MKSVERARRVMSDMVLVELEPMPSERIIAAALAEARAHGAALVLMLLKLQGNLDEPVITKLSTMIEKALELDEKVSSEPGA